MTVGNWITIFPDGYIRVGEMYVGANGKLMHRGTSYRTDGTTVKYDDGDDSSEEEHD